jgi:hypothetical protein
MYVSAIVLIHLFFNVAHGLAHRELAVGLTTVGSVCVLAVILLCPLLAMALTWTERRQLGLFLLSASMFASLVFGAYHHFFVVSPDHVRIQPRNSWGDVFVFTAYGLLVSELIGSCLGLLLLRAGAQKGAKLVKDSPRHRGTASGQND